MVPCRGTSPPVAPWEKDTCSSPGVEVLERHVAVAFPVLRGNCRNSAAIDLRAIFLAARREEHQNIDLLVGHGTKEMTQPCLIYRRAISLAARGEEHHHVDLLVDRDGRPLLHLMWPQSEVIRATLLKVIPLTHSPR